MSRRSFWNRIGTTCVVAIGLYYAYLMVTRGPILAATLGERDCACGDLHQRVTKLVLWNPIRNRAPERAGDEFLRGLRDDHCKSDPEVCTYALPTHRVSSWRLAYREERASGVVLYYRLTKYGRSGFGNDLMGEGALYVVRGSAGWRVTSYSSYF